MRRIFFFVFQPISNCCILMHLSLKVDGSPLFRLGTWLLGTLCSRFDGSRWTKWEGWSRMKEAWCTRTGIFWCTLNKTTMRTKIMYDKLGIYFRTTRKKDGLCRQRSYYSKVAPDQLSYHLLHQMKVDQFCRRGRQDRWTVLGAVSNALVLFERCWTFARDIFQDLIIHLAPNKPLHSHYLRVATHNSSRCFVNHVFTRYSIRNVALQ